MFFSPSDKRAGRFLLRVATRGEWESSGNPVSSQGKSELLVPVGIPDEGTFEPPEGGIEPWEGNAASGLGGTRGLEPYQKKEKIMGHQGSGTGFICHFLSSWT